MSATPEQRTLVLRALVKFERDLGFMAPEVQAERWDELRLAIGTLLDAPQSATCEVRIGCTKPVERQVNVRAAHGRGSVTAWACAEHAPLYLIAEDAP